jgi:hypothetical protein
MTASSTTSTKNDGTNTTIGGPTFNYPSLSYDASLGHSTISPKNLLITGGAHSDAEDGADRLLCCDMHASLETCFHLMISHLPLLRPLRFLG